jgi:hypothetical protein
MKKLLLFIFLFIVGAIAFNPAVFAAEYNTFSLAPEVSYIKYDEPDVMKEKGLMYGIGGSYAYHNDSFLIREEARINYGEIDYKNSGTLDNIKDYIIEARAVVGYEYPASTSATLTPYAGIGYRYLNDGMGDKNTSTGEQGYEREIYYLYTPIGLELTAPIDDKWSFGATLEYDLFWRGWVKSHLSDVEAGLGVHYDDLENTQKRGYGLRGSLKFLRNWEKWDLIIEPFIRYWNIKKSDEKNVTIAGLATPVYGYEPKNNSTEGGLMVTCRWGSGRDRSRYRYYDYKKTTMPAPIKTEIRPATKVPEENAYNYYENVRREIAIAVSYIKTAEKGRARVNMTLSPEGRVLAVNVRDEGAVLSETLKKNVADMIYAVAPFPSVPAYMYQPEISFTTPIIFE